MATRIPLSAGQGDWLMSSGSGRSGDRNERPREGDATHGASPDLTEIAPLLGVIAGLAAIAAAVLLAFVVVGP